MDLPRLTPRSCTAVLACPSELTAVGLGAVQAAADAPEVVICAHVCAYSDIITGQAAAS